MDFLILGTTQLLVAGQPVDLGSMKQRQLLAWLLLHARQPVRAETLADQLWPSKPWSAVKSTLHQLVSRTRRVLAGVDLPDALVTVPHSRLYRLDIDPELIDFHRFERMVRTARKIGAEDDSDAVAALLSQALELWRGEPLAELASDDAERLRDHLTDTLWLSACRLLIDCQIRSGHHHAALARLEPLLAHYEHDQTLAAQWMEALIAAGRGRDACGFFLRFRQRLHRDNDEPLPELITLYARAQRQATSAPNTPTPQQTDISRSPHQLPRDLREFTGQQPLLAELDTVAFGSTNRAGIIVIDGMPGIGKTALAVHWAHRHKDRFPDGQLYINANGYGPGVPIEHREILGRFLHALGVAGKSIPRSTEHRRELLDQILAPQRVLIVIDNAFDAGQVLPLLTTAPRCLTLITSRTHLAALTVNSDAHSITTPPLSGPDRLLLLQRTIGAERAGQDLAAAQALAQESGGLPLALRLIADHIRIRPRAQLADLVDDLVDHLLANDGNHEANLQRVFSWSYTTLDPDCQMLYRRLGLFPGQSIGIDAAAVLLETSRNRTERLLDALADAHLIDHDTAHRYRLHDLLHQDAARRSHDADPHDDRHDIRVRLLDWYVLSGNNAAAKLSPSRAPVPDLPQPTAVIPETFTTDIDALTWCEQERDNVSALTRYAAAHGLDKHAWQLPNTMHEVYERYGSQDDVLDSLETALTSARRLSDNVAAIGTTNNLGTAYFAIRDLGRGVALFEDGLRLARASGSREGEAVCTHNLARFRLELADYHEAVRLYEKALDIYREIANPAGEAFSLHRLGDVHQHIDRPTEALSYYHQSLTLRERIGSLRGQATTHTEIARVHLRLGQLDRAHAHCQRALRLHGRTHDQATTCDAWLILATIRNRQGMHAEAADHAQTSLDLARGLSDTDRVARARRILSSIHTTLDANAAATVPPNFPSAILAPPSGDKATRQ